MDHPFICPAVQDILKSDAKTERVCTIMLAWIFLYYIKPELINSVNDLQLDLIHFECQIGYIMMKLS